MSGRGRRRPTGWFEAVFGCTWRSPQCAKLLSFITCTGTFIGIATLVISSIVLVFALESRASGGGECAALTRAEIRAVVVETLAEIQRSS